MESQNLVDRKKYLIKHNKPSAVYHNDWQVVTYYKDHNCFNLNPTIHFKNISRILDLEKKSDKMKTKLENINGTDYLFFKVNEEIGLMQLPVITKGTRQGTNAYTWNGDLERPTLRPSIRTGYHNGKEMTEIHYWLNDGVADCLGDCKDGNSGKKLTLLEMANTV